MDHREREVLAPQPKDSGGKPRRRSGVWRFPRSAMGLFFPGLLEPRRRTDKALWEVIERP